MPINHRAPPQSRIVFPLESPFPRVVCAQVDLRASRPSTSGRNNHKGGEPFRVARPSGDASRSLDGAASDGPVHPSVWGDASCLVAEADALVRIGEEERRIARKPFVRVVCDQKDAILKTERTPPAAMPGKLSTGFTCRRSHGWLGTLRLIGPGASGRCR